MCGTLGKVGDEHSALIVERYTLGWSAIPVVIFVRWAVRVACERLRFPVADDSTQRCWRSRVESVAGRGMIGPSRITS